jgi:hypothetical protein
MHSSYQMARSPINTGLTAVGTVFSAGKIIEEGVNVDWFDKRKK